MVYLDTNVLISYIDEADPNHGRARELVDELDVKVVSELTLVELGSVFSRAGLENPVALAYYAVRRVGAETLRLDFKSVSRVALRIAPILGLRTLDLLHVAICLANNVGSIATFDSDILGKRGDLEGLGLKVLGD